MWWVMWGSLQANCPNHLLFFLFYLARNFGCLMRGAPFFLLWYLHLSCHLDLICVLFDEYMPIRAGLCSPHNCRSFVDVVPVGYLRYILRLGRSKVLPKSFCIGIEKSEIVVSSFQVDAKRPIDQLYDGYLRFQSGRLAPRSIWLVPLS